MDIQPMNPILNDLRMGIRRHEVQEQLEFDRVLQDLRHDKLVNHYGMPTDSYTGNVFRSSHCGDFIVTEYFNYDKIAIVFLDTGYRMLARANNINKGEVKDPYAPSILGVGCIGVGPYNVDGTPFERMIYSRWRGILDRVYVKHEGRKTVNPEWLNFQYFAAWFVSEYYEVPYNSMYDMVVDKDVLYPCNEEYGPNKCIILPNFINSKIQIKDHERDRIDMMLRGQMDQYNMDKLFRYKESKEARVRIMADENISILPPHVYLAIKNFRLF